MALQQQFLEIISSNIANAQTTRTPEGGAYQRQIAIASAGSGQRRTTAVVRIARRAAMVYDPGHPDADADGFVEYPNVDVNTELVDLMVARRVHEANVSVFQAAKSHAARALDI